MPGHIIEIHEDGRHLSKYRGFLCVHHAETELGRIPLSEVVAVILSANRASLSTTLIAALAEQNTPIITCGEKYLPTAITLPYSGNYESAHRMRNQIAASRPLCKQIWRVLVQEKIRNQAAILAWQNHASVSRRLEKFVRQVKSGDLENMEAQAARCYWPSLLGEKFSRDRTADNSNILFNYAYTVLRSAAARSVVGAGLLPALGVHHKGRLNPFSLVDDIMEPYRPLADSLVMDILQHSDLAPCDQWELSPAIKKQLISLLFLDLRTETGFSPLFEVLHKLALSLVHSYAGKACNLVFAQMILEDQPCNQEQEEDSN